MFRSKTTRYCLRWYPETRWETHYARAPVVLAGISALLFKYYSALFRLLSCSLSCGPPICTCKLRYSLRCILSCCSRTSPACYLLILFPSVPRSALVSYSAPCLLLSTRLVCRQLCVHSLHLHHS